MTYAISRKIFRYFSVKISNFCGFVRSNICQFMFEKKIFISFTLFRGGVWTKSVKFKF